MVLLLGLGRVKIRFWVRIKSRIRVRTLGMIGVHVMLNVRDRSMVIQKG